MSNVQQSNDQDVDKMIDRIWEVFKHEDVELYNIESRVSKYDTAADKEFDEELAAKKALVKIAKMKKKKSTVKYKVSLYEFEGWRFQ